MPDSVKDLLATVNDVGVGKTSLDAAIIMNADVDTSYYRFGWIISAETQAMDAIIRARRQKINSALGLDEQEFLKLESPLLLNYIDIDRRTATLDPYLPPLVWSFPH